MYRAGNVYAAYKVTSHDNLLHLGGHSMVNSKRLLKVFPPNQKFTLMKQCSSEQRKSTLYHPGRTVSPE